MNKIKFAKKLLLILATGSTISLAVGCSKKQEEMISTSFQTLTEIEREDSCIDEIMDMNEEIRIKLPNQEELEKIDLLNAMNTLEEYINLENEIDDIKKIRTNKELDDIRKEEIHEMTYEQKLELISLYENGDLKDVEKARIAMDIKYIKEYIKKWLDENANPILESIIKRIFKGAACQVSGLEPEKYKDCTIYYDREFFLTSSVTVNDDESNTSYSYKVASDSEIYYDLMYGLTTAQSDKCNRNKLIEIINIAKIAIETPATLSENNHLIPVISKEDAKNKVLSYTQNNK